MSAATAIISRDPRARYEGGFDRWSREARLGWSVVCRESEQRCFAIGDGESVWSWDDAGRIWERVDGQTASRMLREHAQAMHRLRRAVLVVKLLSSKIDGERGAARSALQRIGSGIVADWHPGSGDSASGALAWLDHPASVYLSVTRDCRFHLAERERMAFDPSIYAWLVAAAQEDFLAGRRSQPPRLRPDDLVHLQANLGPHVPEPPDFSAEAPMDGPIFTDDPVAEAEHEAESAHFARLREALAETVDQEILIEQSARRRRRRLWLVSTSVAASVVVAIVGLAVF